MGRSIPSVDDATNLFDDEIMAALQAALASSREPSVRPPFASLRSALDGGRSACFMWIGDSTGDSTGADSADLRTPTRLARLIGEAYPDYHVMSRTLKTDGTGYGVPVTLQAAPGGRRFAHFAGDRSLRYRPADYATTRFTSGNIDVRVLFKPDSGWVGSTNRALVSRRKKDVDGVATTGLEQFRFFIEPAGTLRLDWSTSGTGIEKQNNRSSVPVSLPTDVPVWLRATLVLAAGAYTETFYTSLDGDKWDQLGTAIGPYASAPMFDAYDGFFEIGAESWQPASGAAVGNIYEIEIRDGINGPTVAPVLPELWERYADVAAATYSGAPTLILLNASRSGTTMGYHSNPTRLAAETMNYGQSVVIFNDSHNEGGLSGPAGWTIPYSAWVAAVRARLPLSSVAVVLQNPHTTAWANEAAYGYSHKLRLDELRRLAAVNSWGTVDLFTAFLADKRGLDALVQTDGLHPTQDGYILAAEVALSAMGITA